MIMSLSSHSRLLELKKQLKTWEAGFQVEHNRKPSKEDVQNASQVIKDAYAEYTRLKKASAGQEKSAAEDVWGKHLNRNTSRKGCDDESGNPASQVDVGYSIYHFTEKLKANSSKYVKKLPMSLKKNKLNKGTANVTDTGKGSFDTSKDSLIPEDDCQTGFNGTGSSGTSGQKFITPKLKILSSKKSVSNEESPFAFSCPSAIKNIQYRRSSVSREWLERCKPDLPSQDKPMDSGVNSYSEEESTEQPFAFESCNKKPDTRMLQNPADHVDVIKHMQNGLVSEPPENQQICQNLSAVNNVTCIASQAEHSKLSDSDAVLHNKKIKAVSVNDMRDCGDLDLPLQENLDDTASNSAKRTRKGTTSGTSAKRRRINSGDGCTEAFQLKHRQSKKRKMDQQQDDNAQDVFEFPEGCAESNSSQGDDNEAAASVKKNSVSGRGKQKNINSVRKQNASEDSADDNGGLDHMESDMKTINPWQPSMKDDDDDDDDDEVDVIQQRKKAAYGARVKAVASTKKPTSGKSLNENFVRLNMKRKRYHRKGAVMTGGKYKRMQWKQKMSNIGQGGCFKCGETGHWAKNCSGRKRKNIDWGSDDVKKSQKEEDGGNSDPEDVCPFPTLEEAAQMALGVKRPQGTSKGQDDETRDKTNEGVVNKGTDVEVPMAFIPPVYIAPEPPASIEPLYNPGHDGQVIATPSKVFDALNKMGYSSFRPGQENAVMRIMSGLSTLVVLSTGAGKSLCYQLPAYMYSQRSPCITLVISPLVSLMEDQVLGLPRCLKGARLHSNMTKTQREKVVKEIMDGKVQVLLVSPEALVGGGWGRTGCLPPISQLPPIAFACIDEAHCVSEWSHHFRPSYLRLCKVLRDRLGVRCFLGLTATATLTTAASVAEHLGIRDYSQAVVRGAAVPGNLHLSVSRDANRDRAVVSLLKGDRFCHLDSIIVYCTRREQTERLASLLRTCLPDTHLISSEEKVDQSHETAAKSKKKVKPKAARKPVAANSVDSYHAGKSAAERRRIQNQFMSGQLRIVVATVAFGMGLDKSDVRAIIHFNLPKSFENYVQEIGRAGRDGKAAHCHLFLDPEGHDLREIRRHTYGNTVDRNVIRKLVRRCFKKCKCRQLHESQLNRYTDKVSTSMEEDFPDDGIDYSQITEEELLQGAASTEKANQGTDNADGNAEAEVSAAAVDCSQSPKDASRCVRVPAQRICPGHEVALCIDDTVENLDIKEEGIETLLCYLELHPKQWIENLQPTTSTCTINCYGGPKQLRAIAKRCPPVAVAIAKDRLKGIAHNNDARIEFPVVEIASSMGWDSVAVKRELRQLQWINELTPGKAIGSKSGVMVEFSDLSFHFRAPGDLTDDELDEVGDFLADRVMGQEKAELYQLQCVYKSLHSVSFSEYWHCSEEVDVESSEKLKSMLSKYFERQPADSNGVVGKLAGGQDLDADCFSQMHIEECIQNEDMVRRDIRSFVCLHHDRSFTGRAVARIFHGIESPCYPAKVWGRDRRYWRAHLDADFNSLIKIANQELLNMR